MYKIDIITGSLHFTALLIKKNSVDGGIFSDLPYIQNCTVNKNNIQIYLRYDTTLNKNIMQIPLLPCPK